MFYSTAVDNITIGIYVATNTNTAIVDFFIANTNTTIVIPIETYIPASNTTTIICTTITTATINRESILNF
jgi:hypothetical protein